MNIDRLNDILTMVWQHGFNTCNEGWFNMASGEAPDKKKRDLQEASAIDWALQRLVPRDEYNTWVLVKVGESLKRKASNDPTP